MPLAGFTWHSPLSRNLHVFITLTVNCSPHCYQQCQNWVSSPVLGSPVPPCTCDADNFKSSFAWWCPGLLVFWFLPCYIHPKLIMFPVLQLPFMSGFLCPLLFSIIKPLSSLTLESLLVRSFPFPKTWTHCDFLAGPATAVSGLERLVHVRMTWAQGITADTDTFQEENGKQLSLNYWGNKDNVLLGTGMLPPFAL